MKKSLVVSFFAISGIALSSMLHAAGSSYKPLNYKPLNYTPLKYGSSSTRRPSSSYSKPSSFPGQGSSHMNATASSKTAGKLPGFSSFPPSGGNNSGSGGVSTSSVSSGIPSSVSTGKPSSFPGQGSSHMSDTALNKTVGKLPNLNSFPPSGGNNPGSVGVSTSSMGSGIPVISFNRQTSQSATFITRRRISWTSSFLYSTGQYWRWYASIYARHAERYKYENSRCGSGWPGEPW